MKIVMDEMCRGLSRYLRGLGWVIIDVDNGAKDDQIRDIAIKERAIIVTKDRIMAHKCLKAEIPCLRLKVPSIMVEALAVNDQLRNFQFIENIKKPRVSVGKKPNKKTVKL